MKRSQRGCVERETTPKEPSGQFWLNQPWQKPVQAQLGWRNRVQKAFFLFKITITGLSAILSRPSVKKFTSQGSQNYKGFKPCEIQTYVYRFGVSTVNIFNFFST